MTEILAIFAFLIIFLLKITLRSELRKTKPNKNFFIFPGLGGGSSRPFPKVWAWGDWGNISVYITWSIIHYDIKTNRDLKIH